MNPTWFEISTGIAWDGILDAAQLYDSWEVGGLAAMFGPFFCLGKDEEKNPVNSPSWYDEYISGGLNTFQVVQEFFHHHDK